MKSENLTEKVISELKKRYNENYPFDVEVIVDTILITQKLIEEKNLHSKMILQVHDELIFDVVPEELEIIKELVREQMEGAVNLTVPLLVNLGVGENWYDLK
jgi:DNA polymerase-1